MEWWLITTLLVSVLLNLILVISLSKVRTNRNRMFRELKKQYNTANISLRRIDSILEEAPRKKER